MRVLEVFREPFAFGGQESFIMNMFRHMDHDLVQMDFLTPFDAPNTANIEEIEREGGKVYAYNHPFGKEDNKAFRQSLEDFLSKHEGEYDILHIHSGSTYALMMGPKIAKKYGIPVRIVHSHSGGFENWKHRLIKSIAAPVFRKYTTDFAACSVLAGKWKFPDDVVENKLRVFANAIDLNRFHYDPKVRKEVREEMGVDENTFVLGHVGRFSLQKNHEALLRIFADFYKIHPNARLWMVGIGERMDEMKALAKELGIEEAVVFFGLRGDVNRLYQAMDVFVLPSFFEGLPMVGIEAQATGLYVLCSDLIARELPISDHVQYLSLDDRSLWVHALEEAMHFERKDTRREMEQAGFEVEQAAKTLQNFYLSKVT